jgi:Tfp pilus assembly protein PilF
MKTLSVVLLSIACFAQQLDMQAAHRFAQAVEHERKDYQKMLKMREGPKKEKLKAKIRNYLVRAQGGTYASKASLQR